MHIGQHTHTYSTHSVCLSYETARTLCKPRAQGNCGKYRPRPEMSGLFLRPGLLAKHLQGHFPWPKSLYLNQTDRREVIA